MTDQIKGLENTGVCLSLLFSELIHTQKKTQQDVTLFGPTPSVARQKGLAQGRGSRVGF